MRPLYALCAVLAGTAILALAWSARPAPRGGLTVVFGDEPRTLDPALATVVLEGKILSALLEGLTVPDAATLEPRPGVAERWENSQDGRTWTFHLREALWSDGTRVTAGDFRRSWLRVLETPEAANWELLGCIRGAREYRAKKKDREEVGLAAPDERTLVVTLEARTDWFLSLISGMTFLPVPATSVATHGRHWTRPGNLVGNGPFTLSRWDPNHQIVALRNPRYHGAARVTIPAITFLSVPSGTTAYNLYAGGVVDWIANVQPDMVRDLKGSPDLHLAPQLGVSFVRMAANHEPFSDNRVRRAFDLAIDRERIVKVNGAGQIPSAAFVPPGVVGYTASHPPLRDVSRARSLLAAAGFPNGNGFPTVRFLYPAQKDYRVVAESLQAIWQEALGVTIVLDRVDRKEWFRRMREVDYELCLSSWIPDYNDANTFLEIFVAGSGNNRTGWKDEIYDALIAQAAGESGATRQATLATAEARLLAEGPAAPLYIPVTIELWRPSVHGVHENLLGVHPFAGIEVRR